MKKYTCCNLGAKVREGGLAWDCKVGTKVAARSSSELLGASRSFLGARGPLPWRSSELLEASSELPWRTPQGCPPKAQGGHPQAVAGGRILQN